MGDRVTLVETSPRVAPGLLTAVGWDLLRSAEVWTASPEHPQLPALRAAGVSVNLFSDPAADGAEPAPADGASDRVAATAGPALLAQLRASGSAPAGVAWLLDPSVPTAADRALLAAADTDVDVDVLLAVVDLPGSALLDAVAVMDRLRSPGGCPWDAEQTHDSLAPYLLEEAYEAYQAIEDGDLAELREELGDVLMQVLFHARVAAEAGAEGWDIDAVAAGLSAKLIRRHPHVFGNVTVAGAGEVVTNWEAIKKAEKGRKSVTEGVPLASPALTLAAKLQKRAAGVGVPADLVLPSGPAGSPAGSPPAGSPPAGSATALPATEMAGIVADLAAAAGAAPSLQAGDAEPAGHLVGDLLFAVVALARAVGVDPETALRARARAFRDGLAAAEHAAHTDGTEPGDLDPAGWRALWS